MPCQICSREFGDRRVCDECYEVVPINIVNVALGLDHHPGKGRVTEAERAIYERVREVRTSLYLAMKAWDLVRKAI